MVQIMFYMHRLSRMSNCLNEGKLGPEKGKDVSHSGYTETSLLGALAPKKHIWGKN
jgi:hypothetical protein